MLADLRAAVDLGDWPGALDEALALWRKHRYSLLVPVIEQLGERIPDRPGPPKKKGTHQWWCGLARGGDPRDVTRLVAHADANRGAPSNVQQVLRERGDMNPLAHALRTALSGNEQFFHAQWGAGSSAPCSSSTGRTRIRGGCPCSTAGSPSRRSRSTSGSCGG